MPQIRKTIGDTDYTFGVIPIGVARRLNTNSTEGNEFNVAFIAASLKAGGMENATPDYVDSLPFYGGVFDGLLAGAFEANGLKIREKKPAGEDAPAAEAQAAPALEIVPATASTSDTSTEA